MRNYSMSSVEALTRNLHLHRALLVAFVAVSSIYKLNGPVILLLLIYLKT